MIVELNEQEIIDVRIALIMQMKVLDESGNSADKILSDRLEVIEKKLLDINK